MRVWKASTMDSRERAGPDPSGRPRISIPAGLSWTSMRDIAQAAGVTKPLILPLREQVAALREPPQGAVDSCADETQGAERTGGAGGAWIRARWTSPATLPSSPSPPGDHVARDPSPRVRHLAEMARSSGRSSRSCAMARRRAAARDRPDRCSSAALDPRPLCLNGLCGDRETLPDPGCDDTDLLLNGAGTGLSRGFRARSPLSLAWRSPSAGGSRRVLTVSLGHCMDRALREERSLCGASHASARATCSPLFRAAAAHRDRSLHPAVRASSRRRRP
jgi:hypothetical protein